MSLNPINVATSQQIVAPKEHEGLHRSNSEPQIPVSEDTFKLNPKPVSQEEGAKPLRLAQVDDDQLVRKVTEQSFKKQEIEKPDGTTSKLSNHATLTQFTTIDAFEKAHKELPFDAGIFDNNLGAGNEKGVEYFERTAENKDQRPKISDMYSADDDAKTRALKAGLSEKDFFAKGQIKPMMADIGAKLSKLIR